MKRSRFTCASYTVSLAYAVILIPASAIGADAKKAYLDDHEEKITFSGKHASVAPDSGKDSALSFDLGGVSVQFGGFAQADWIYDADFVGNDGQFKVNSIAVPPDPNAELGGSSNVQARATRFSMDLRSTEGPSSGLRAYVEGDFFGSGNSFRLRHAYGTWNGILAGQTWTTFQDISARPLTLDYEGPDAEVFVRQAMIRYTAEASESLQWSVALEDPGSEVSVQEGDAGTGRTELPDLAGNLRWSGANSHLQLAGLLRQISYEASDGSGDDDDATGWGLSLSGRTEFGGTALMGQVAYGDGMGRYVESFAGTDSDAVLNDRGGLETLGATAVVLGAEQQWSQRFSSTLSGAYAEIDNSALQGAQAIRHAISVHANLIYTQGQFQTGVELMWGERENNDGASADAFRVQTTVRYRFR